jgi:hypothetical protein
MEMKMFVSSDSISVEKNVNDWLVKNNVSVHHIGQSQSEKNGKFVFTLSVFYEYVPTALQRQIIKN